MLLTRDDPFCFYRPGDTSRRVGHTSLVAGIVVWQENITGGIGGRPALTGDGRKSQEPPLAGVSVLEAGRFISAPYAAMLLGDLGAEVIKIEAPGSGDPFRSWREGQISPRFVACNRGKKSITLDLNTHRGKQVLSRLLHGADVFIHNFRPESARRLEIDYPTLESRYPRLVYCSITGTGEAGPFANKPMYDQVGQALSGFMSVLNQRLEPRPVGPAFSDTITAIFTAYGILGALHARFETGRGQEVHTSMLQATISFLTEPATHYLMTGEVTSPSTRPHNSQSYGFLGSDGCPFVVHLSSPDKFWKSFVSSIGRPELVDDPRFVTYTDRVQHYDELEEELSPLFRTQPAKKWLELLDEMDVPCAPILTMEDIFTHEDLRHLNMRVDFPSESGGPIATVGRAVELSHLHPLQRPPRLGEHTMELLAAIGYTDVESEGMRRDGVV